MNLRVLGLAGFLVLATAGILWLVRQTEMQAALSESPKTHVPDYYFTDATVTSLDIKGRPASEMKAPRMIHHPDDDSVEVFQPRMRYFTKNGPPWYAQSDHGVEPSGGNLIYLDGHVQLTHPNQNGGPPLVINTDRMTVDLDSNIASTDDRVVMTQGVSHMTGLGMDGYMQDDRMILRTDVKSYYVPKQK